MSPINGIYDVSLLLDKDSYDETLITLRSILPDCEPLMPCTLDNEERFLNICRAKAPRAATNDEYGLRVRICYVQRRMWMLARKSRGEPCCPDVEEIREALRLTVIMLERCGAYRILNACDALMNMTKSAPPKLKQKRMLDAAHVADMAYRALYVSYVEEGFLHEN